jgi:ribosomal protein S18 acetylase RimI-like enzyme
MEIKPLQQFKSHALRTLFVQERKEWARRLYWDYSEPQRVISAMIDSGSLPGFVAIHSGQPIAYCFYVEVAGKGLLGGCFSSAEGEGSEEGLLERSVAVLKRNPDIGRIESQFINFKEWPINRFFAAEQFSQFDRCFMVRDCQTPVPRHPVNAGLQQLNPGDLDEMARLTLGAYASVVDRIVTYHYQSLAACREFLGNLLFRPGCGNFLPEASYSVRDLGTNELMGYVVTSRVSAHDGHIPQITVAPSHQGKGLGAGLLGRVIRFLALNGYRRVSLTVTESNLAALTLYQRFGFSVHFRFPTFAWLRARMATG